MFRLDKWQYGNFDNSIIKYYITIINIIEFYRAREI